ncbi:MAG: ATP-binding cassette domain-containing protein [Planctomycetes bacterium]|nr:ATP-binding cassette domain-containing protein [Planctomycetota bacterium]
MAEAERSSDALLRADTVTLTYQDGRNVVHALREVSLDIGHGEFVGILGPSGSGKSSLLYALSGIRLPATGSVYLNGQAINSPGFPREAVRRRSFGFIFQQYFLINYLNVVQNIVVGAVRENAHKPDVAPPRKTGRFFSGVPPRRGSRIYSRFTTVGGADRLGLANPSTPTSLMNGAGALVVGAGVSGGREFSFERGRQRLRPQDVLRPRQPFDGWGM